MCILIFSVMFETFLILRIFERDMIEMYNGLNLMYSLFLSALIKLKSSGQIFKNTPISKVMKIRTVGAALFLAVRWTDRLDKAYSRFQHFCELA
jgi:hypothetical protein